MISILSLPHKNFLESSDINNFIYKKIKTYSKKIPSKFFFSDGSNCSFYFSKILKLKKYKLKVRNYELKNIEIEYYKNTKIAFFDIQMIVGIKKINKKIQTLNYSSYGIGEAIEYLLKKKIKKIFISLGGSVNTDAGLGILQKFNYVAFKKNYNHKNFLTGKDLTDKSLKYILPKKKEKIKLILLSDSNVRPFGISGQCRTFGPQKKLNKSQIKKHDIAIKFFTKKLSKLSNINLNKEYYGSGGAIPVSLCSIFDCTVKNASEYFFEKLNLNKKIKNSKLIISSEGILDKTSLKGKGFKFLLNYCVNNKKKLLFICGQKKINIKHKNLKIINMDNKILNKRIFYNKLNNKLRNLNIQKLTS